MGNTALKGTTKSKKGGVTFGLTTNLSKNELSTRSNTFKLGGRNSKSMTKITPSHTIAVTKKLPPPSPKDLSYEKSQINKFKTQTGVNKNDGEIIEKSLTNHYLFHYVENETIKKLMTKLIKCEVKKDIVIYEKDCDDAEFFYILTKGKMHYNAQVSEKSNEFQDLSIKPGNCFGDYEIINDISRLCDVVSDEDCVFYVLKRNDLLDILKNVRKKKLS